MEDVEKLFAYLEKMDDKKIRIVAKEMAKTFIDRKKYRALNLFIETCGVGRNVFPPPDRQAYTDLQYNGKYEE